MILNYFTFKLDSISCKKCDWNGLGSDLNYGEWSGEGFICEMNCPKCNEVVGFWQAPLKSEEIQWKKDNPSKLTGWDGANF